HSDGPEVSTEACLTECCPDQVVETDLPQIPIKQLQSSIRSELHVAQLESKITVNTSMPFGFSSSHSQWSFVCWKKKSLVTRFQPQRRAFFNSYAAATSRFCRIRVNSPPPEREYLMNPPLSISTGFDAMTQDEKAFFQQLGARIAELRKSAAITQVQLAE